MLFYTSCLSAFKFGYMQRFCSIRPKCCIPESCRSCPCSMPFLKMAPMQPKSFGCSTSPLARSSFGNSSRNGCSPSSPASLSSVLPTPSQLILHIYLAGPMATKVSGSYRYVSTGNIYPEGNYLQPFFEDDSR